MSGDGAYQEHSPVYVPSSALPYVTIPQAQGGGCVKSGPFTNFTVRLGPVSPAFENLTANPQADGLGLNERCLRRDINPWVSSQWTNDLNTSSLITSYTDVSTFQTMMQGDFPNGFLGVHTGGHMTLNADPAGDLFASPGDPVRLRHPLKLILLPARELNTDVEPFSHSFFTTPKLTVSGGHGRTLTSPPAPSLLAAPSP